MRRILNGWWNLVGMRWQRGWHCSRHCLQIFRVRLMRWFRAR